MPDHVLSFADWKLLSEDELNIDIYCFITVDEILKCVDMLRCNKECIEEINNGYIGNTITFHLPFLYWIIQMDF
jgi:hypothetical protein